MAAASSSFRWNGFGDEISGRGSAELQDASSIDIDLFSTMATM
jgi:hypothetical protein